MQTDRRRHEKRTVATLFVGYAGYYVCRSNLSVAGPAMLDDLGPSGFDKGDFGQIASMGVVAYALGKVAHGILADRFGGRALFLLGMCGSIALSLAFGMASSVLALGLIWAGNRWFQSMGWVALVKIAAAWFSIGRLASVMGILSASFLLGDAVARAWLGVAVEFGAGWRVLFYFSAGTLLCIAVLTLLRLRSDPTEVGLDPPEVSPRNAFGEDGGAQRLPLRRVLSSLLRSPVFWAMCGVNFGLTLLRETFNTWNPIFLHEVSGLSAGAAGVGSFLFPAVGGVAAIVAGRLADRPGSSPARVAVPFLVLLVVSLLLLALLPLDGRPVLSLVLLASTAFFLIGPYSFVTGVMAIDLGGRAGSATVAGFVDGAGYLGGILAGVGIGELAEVGGWGVAFGALAFVAAVSVGIALVQRRVHAAHL
ncbi:MAG: MFS transporter [Planctomycetota bacterium]|nr:MFS transporter [Planctomycetota bacterium]MDA0932918.1 MFS transporter [Planctomycetota bacterium]